jgi:predicted naringenin-chalcone synthase
VSSASVLFAFERLHAEGVTKAGDVGVMIAMGPGMTIETALMTW